MAYAHYFKRIEELPKEPFATAVFDCHDICEFLRIPIGDDRGDAFPAFGEEELCFNGHRYSEDVFSTRAGSNPWPSDNAWGVALKGDNPVIGYWPEGTVVRARALSKKGDGAGEPFHIDRVIDWGTKKKPDGSNLFVDGCTTGYRPYDLSVQCCLIIMEHLMPGMIQVSSSGTSQQWNEARGCCHEFLGYGWKFRLTNQKGSEDA